MYILLQRYLDQQHYFYFSTSFYHQQSNANAQKDVMVVLSLRNRGMHDKFIERNVDNYNNNKYLLQSGMLANKCHETSKYLFRSHELVANFLKTKNQQLTVFENENSLNANIVVWIICTC